MRACTRTHALELLSKEKVFLTKVRSDQRLEAQAPLQPPIPSHPIPSHPTPPHPIPTQAKELADKMMYVLTY